jgi:hypothetical protein
MDLWRGSGYKIINGELIRQKVGDAAANKYIGTAKTITREQAVEAIKTIRGMMKPLTQTNAVYRGCSNMFKKNCHLETFVSVTVNKEDAEAFQDDGTVYSISIQPGVKGVKTGVEGEILIEDGCFWEYTRNKVLIHPPDSNKGFEWCSSMPKTSSTCPMVHNVGLTPEEEALIQGGVTRRSRKLAVTRRRRGGRRKLNRLRSLRRH